MKNNNFRELTESEIENVSGGYDITYAAHNDVKLSKEEYDFLKQKGIIDDEGKLKHKDVQNAEKALLDAGYKAGEVRHLKFMYKDYKPPLYADVTIVGDKNEGEEN